MIFAVGLTLFKVAIKVASILALKSIPILLIKSVVFPEPNTNISSVNGSNVPSALIKIYLSSSNDKNVSLAPALTVADNELPAASIITSYLFLIDKVALLKSTSEIKFLGICVYNVFSESPPIAVSKIAKSGTDNVATPT